uniref:RRM domain-containing protein n=1 Tax=Chromera velia CCMP2878 TaxID=1169474 RepID=A0A0G4EYF7_9ALVE|eukprot:Cvel_14285.t1-p1 / transcript=Cvel_14285.t1 / gene=Cvel_14285 / organism=Chromera_velia_CCMP2878 / gene_product=hypothetical protein / transcript_product=hypothetical protein / location=Cvel_scaffold1009:468-3658(+) / protein_length=777 / sequence_SO=supercontig / SO=protein_coding / is_pseudo=false
MEVQPASFGGHRSLMGKPEGDHQRVTGSANTSDLVAHKVIEQTSNGDQHGFHQQQGMPLGDDQSDRGKHGLKGANLYVQNIPRFWGRTELEAKFSFLGAISSCYIMTDHLNPRFNTGVGFVCFETHALAEDAILRMHGTVLGPHEENRRLTVTVKRDEVEHCPAGLRALDARIRQDLARVRRARTNKQAMPPGQQTKGGTKKASTARHLAAGGLNSKQLPVPQQQPQQQQQQSTPSPLFPPPERCAPGAPRGVAYRYEGGGSGSGGADPSGGPLPSFPSADVAPVPVRQMSPPNQLHYGGSFTQTSDQRVMEAQTPEHSPQHVQAPPQTAEWGRETAQTITTAPTPTMYPGSSPSPPHYSVPSRSIPSDPLSYNPTPPAGSYSEACYHPYYPSTNDTRDSYRPPQPVQETTAYPVTGQQLRTTEPVYATATPDYPAWQPPSSSPPLPTALPPLSQPPSAPTPNHRDERGHHYQPPFHPDRRSSYGRETDHDYTRPTQMPPSHDRFHPYHHDHHVATTHLDAAERALHRHPVQQQQQEHTQPPHPYYHYQADATLVEERKRDTHLHILAPHQQHVTAAVTQPQTVSVPSPAPTPLDAPPAHVPYRPPVSHHPLEGPPIYHYSEPLETISPATYPRVVEQPQGRESYGRDSQDAYRQQHQVEHVKGHDSRDVYKQQGPDLRGGQEGDEDVYRGGAYMHQQRTGSGSAYIPAAPLLLPDSGGRPPLVSPPPTAPPAVGHVDKQAGGYSEYALPRQAPPQARLPVAALAPDRRLLQEWRQE